MTDVESPADQWLVFLRCDVVTHNYSILKRKDIAEASYRALVRNGDAVLIHPMLSYICEEMRETARAFQHIVPQFEDFIRRALRECAFDDAPFGVQRLRFAIFDYFTRFTTRHLVADVVMKDTSWYYYVSVYDLEKHVLADWYEWFEETGVFVSGSIGFLAETKMHFKKLREIVEWWRTHVE